MLVTVPEVIVNPVSRHAPEPVIENTMPKFGFVRGTLSRMIVWSIPAPCMTMVLEQVTVVAQLLVPAGIVTVSPSEADFIAVRTAAADVSAALMVAAEALLEETETNAISVNHLRMLSLVFGILSGLNGKRVV